MTFAADVPTPKFAYLPPWVTVPHDVQEGFTDELVIINPSLVELHDVTVTVVGVPEGITIGSGGLIGTMPANSSQTLSFRVDPGDYAYLNGSSTFFRITGTYVSFDPVTFEQLDEEVDVSPASIPLVNPSAQKVTVVAPGENEERELKLPEQGDKVELPGKDMRLPNLGEETVTQIVKIEIQQKATMEREGFDARLELTNGLDRELVSLSVSPRVTDAQGVDVTDRFYMVPPELEGISAVDGSANVGAYESMSGRWILIPGSGLGGTELSGKSYWVKAVLTYYVDGRLKETVTEEIEITVHPQPQLYMHYYVPKNVLADEPFRLGVLVENEGDGVATNFKIDSGQPEIVENASGLLIDFDIVGSSFGSVTGDVVRLVLGDIAPHSIAQGYWIMTCTLDGQFIEFSAEMTHRAYKGVEINPLILDVTTEIIQHDYLFADAVDPNMSLTLIDRDQDGFPDYLINLWSGLRLPILIPENIDVTQSPSDQDRTMELIVPETDGYVCIILPDPMPEANLRSIMRRGSGDEEDTYLGGNNFWRDGGNIYFVDELGYIDDQGYPQPTSGTYVLDFRSALAMEDIVSAPTEFDILYTDSAGAGEGIILNQPPPGSALTTYELETPVFYIDIPPTEDHKAAIQAIVTNDGVLAESGVVDFYYTPEGGSETYIDSFVINELRPFRHEWCVVEWTPDEPGDYILTARVPGDSPDAEMSMSVTVNASPFADAGTDFFSTVSEPTTFDGTRSVDDDGFLRSYFWDFGDGVWGSGMTPVHVYDHSGTYQVHLMIKDNNGAMTEDIMQVTINETRPDLLIGDITFLPPEPQEDDLVTVTAHITNNGVSDITDPFNVGLYIDGQWADVF